MNYYDSQFSQTHLRFQVLQFWSRLQRENCVPVNRQREVMKRTVGRLRDKAALVRKAAIQLLKVRKNNPI